MLSTAPSSAPLLVQPSSRSDARAVGLCAEPIPMQQRHRMYGAQQAARVLALYPLCSRQHTTRISIPPGCQTLEILASAPIGDGCTIGRPQPESSVSRTKTPSPYRYFPYGRHVPERPYNRVQQMRCRQMTIGKPLHHSLGHCRNRSLPWATGDMPCAPIQIRRNTPAKSRRPFKRVMKWSSIGAE